MAYFLGINEINKVKESCLDDHLTCLAQYDVTNNFMRETHFCDSRVTVKNHSIIFQTKRKVHKLLYSGKLASHNVATELLESHNEIKESWKNRIKVKVYEKKILYCLFPITMTTIVWNLIMVKNLLDSIMNFLKFRINIL